MRDNYLTLEEFKKIKLPDIVSSVTGSKFLDEFVNAADAI